MVRSPPQLIHDLRILPFRMQMILRLLVRRIPMDLRVLMLRMVP